MISSCRRDAQGLDWGLIGFLIPFLLTCCGVWLSAVQVFLVIVYHFLFILLQALFLINHLLVSPRFVLTICQRHALENSTTLAPYPTPVIATLLPTTLRSSATPTTIETCVTSTFGSLTSYVCCVSTRDFCNVNIFKCFFLRRAHNHSAQQCATIDQ